MPVTMRIRFRDEGFRQILRGSGVASVVAAEARKQAAALESESGRPYTIKQSMTPTRVRYLAVPDGETPRVEGLDHETWMAELWPRVGGPKWRPKR